MNCDHCGKIVSTAEAIHVVEAHIDPCPEFPQGYHSELDLCEACFARTEDVRYEVPNCIVEGKWRVI